MTALFSTSGLFKVFECFAVFTCLVVHRIGNRGSQVWFGTTDFEMGYKETRNEVIEGLGEVGLRLVIMLRLTPRCWDVEFSPAWELCPSPSY